MNEQGLNASSPLLQVTSAEAKRGCKESASLILAKVADWKQNNKCYFETLTFEVLYVNNWQILPLTVSFCHLRKNKTIKTLGMA